MARLSYVHRQLLKTMPIVVGTTVVFFLLFLILRTRLTHRCPAWLIRLCYVLLSISFSCIIGLLSVFSFIPWFVALLVVFVAHLLLYWIWLRFLTRIPQGKYRKNSYDDPEEVSFLIRDPKSEKYDRKITYHWTQVKKLIFILAKSGNASTCINIDLTFNKLILINFGCRVKTYGVYSKYLCLAPIH